MTCTVNIDVNLVQYGRPIQYKYVVSSNRKKEDIYEFLLGSKKDANRILKVPTICCHPKGKVLYLNCMCGLSSHYTVKPV